MPRLPLSTLALAAGGALTLLGGCTTTPADSPVEVTRFHRLPPSAPSRGTIRVLAADAESSSLEAAPYVAAISSELSRVNYQVLPGQAGDSQAIAHVSVTRERYQPDRRGSRVSVGGGGGVGSYGSGVGLGVGIDLSGPPPEMIDTRVSLTIDDARSGERLWEGRAHQTVAAKSQGATTEASAQTLAAALLKGFPGNSGETILVK